MSELQQIATRNTPIIVWFRRDLRLADNPALSQAAKTGQPLIALYIYETKPHRPYGGASNWWLHHSLTSLEKDLKALGVHLVIGRGAAGEIIDEIIEQTGARDIFWNRRYAQTARQTDKAVMDKLKSQGLNVQSFRANLLSEPWEFKTKTGGYYKVFTPYWRKVVSDAIIHPPLPKPKALKAYNESEELGGLTLKTLELLPEHRENTPDWGSKLKPHWQIGEAGANKALEAFLDGPVEYYAEQRNRPDDENGTSKLSPHLAFGEISPRQIWQAAQKLGGKSAKFLSEIGWREFSYTLLYFNPDLASKNFKPAFDGFEWDNNPKNLKAWQVGQTGYPFVDAGMRQLWQTGWQHNRVRMVTASFLIKHLLIDWRLGEDWFHDTLVDADPASNAASWQWVAGSGADASPYFRIFNPFSQGEKFDPDGIYVRKYVPELSAMPDKYIHRPWEAPKHVLEKAGIELGVDYPFPIVEHKFARERALARLKASRE